MIQPFDHDFIYNYNYEAYTEHVDVDNMISKNIRIKCKVVISVPRRCSAKMRVNGCTVAEGVGRGGDEVSYRELPESSAFDRDMSVSEMAFNFNGGQITKIFVDKLERTNITNFKRGILSALQAYNSELPREVEVGEIFEIRQETVYGRGIVKQKILEKETGLPSVVEIVRDTANIELPWERRQWNFIRMRNKARHPLVAAFKDYMTVVTEEAWSRVEQNCIYTLSRGRQVEKAECEEKYPLKPSLPYLTEEVMGGVIESKIHQEINLGNSRRMTASDRSAWDVQRFDEDNIMFEEEWEETNEAYARGFEAETTFINLLREPINEKSPALVSKLSRWMAIASKEEIEGVWERCESECNPEEKSKGRILWAELLNSCINNDWCQIPYCSSENSTTCEDALETFVRSAADTDEEVKEACLVALESVDAPSEKLVDATLKICRGEERNTARCVRALGEVTRNFLEGCKEDCERRKPVENAKNYLARQLKRACSARGEDAEELMIAGAECIGRLGPNGTFAADDILECALNSEAPTIVAVKSLIAYKNITEETVPEEARTKLITLFKNPECSFETRVTCFHVLMTKSIPAAEVEEILKSALEGEDTMLALHVKEDLRTQLLVRGTEFCGLNPEVAEECVKCIVRNKWDIGISESALERKPVEKTFDFTRKLYIPYIDAESECTVVVKTVHETERAALPIIAKLEVYAMVQGRNVSLVEAALDVAGIKPILDRILGENEFYSEIFDKLLKMPINELHGYAKEYPALSALREEGWYTHLLNVFEPNSPLNLKVLGYDIGLEYLMSLESVRQITIGNLWKILDALEEGFEHETFAAGQPLIMQHAAPTCIGAPIITSVDVSYLFKNKLNLKADLRKMLFSNEEEATLNLTPELFGTASVSRTVLTQFCESCGTEMKIEVGHESAVACEAEKNPNGLNVACVPKPGKSTLLYLSGKRSLIGEAGEEPAPTECGEYNFEGICALRACYQPYSRPGFAYEVSVVNELDTEYRSEINWESKTEPDTKKYVKELKVECAAVNRGEKEVLWKSILAFVPSENEVRCDVDCYGMKWYGRSNFMFLRKEETSVVEGCFASFNASGINNLELKYTNTFMILPESENEYKVIGDCSWTEGGRTGGYLLTGPCTETAEGANLTRSAELKLVNKEEPSENLLSVSFKVKKVASAPEILPGYESMLSVGGRLVPYYEKLEVGMHTLGNEESYDKVMMVAGHFGPDESESHFFIHRIKGSWKGREAEEYNTEVYCVCNFFRTEYEAARDADDQVVTHMRIDVPEDRISYAEVKAGENLLKYNTESYNHEEAHYAEISYIKNREEESGDLKHHVKLGYRTWDRLSRSYYKEEGSAKYINHAECKYCHTLAVEHPKVQIGSVHRYKNGPYHFEEGKWIRLHHSILSYISLQPAATYFIMKHLKNEHLSMGYHIKDERPESNNRKAYASAELFENVVNATVEYSNEMWKVMCKVEIPVLPLTCNTTVEMEDTSAREVNIAFAAEYGEMKCDLEGKVAYPQPSTLTAHISGTYALEPEDENEATCDIKVAESNSAITMKGEMKNTRKMTGKVDKWTYVGNSEKYGRNRRNFQLDVLCPESSEEPCTTFTINKNNKWIEYVSKVAEESYDRASITVNDETSTYKLDAKLANEIIGDVDTFSVSLEMGRQAYGLAVESRICNASYRYSEQEGLNAVTKIKNRWMDYDMTAIANTEKIEYAIVYNTAREGGIRIENKFNMAYAFLNFNKDLDATVFLGSKPGSFGCGIKLPDLECMLDISVEAARPEERGFRYLCSAQVLPDKIVIKNLTVPVMGAEIEVIDTTLGCEIVNDRVEEVYVKDLDLTWRHMCRSEEPTIVKGDCVINYDKIVMDIADESRSVFVADVKLEPGTPKKSMNFVITLPFSKVDLGWELENEANKLALTLKCELCSIDESTEKMTPFFTYNCRHEIEETPEGGNFPIVAMDCEMTHTLWIPFVPKKIAAITTTTKEGGVTTMKYETTWGDAKVVELTVALDGCHKRIELVPGYAICVPNTLDANSIWDLPIMKCKDNIKIAKAENDWDVEYNTEWTLPFYSRTPKAAAVSCKVEAAACPPNEELCIPSRIAVKNFNAELPGEILAAFLPSHLWLIPLEFEHVHLENCDMIYTRTTENDVTENKAMCVLRGPSLEEPLSVGLTLGLGPDKLECGFMSGEDIVNNFEFVWNAENWGCMAKHEMRSPWMDSTMELTTRNIVMVEGCMLTMKTKGALEEFLPVDINLHIGEEKWEGSCECKLGENKISLKKSDEGYDCSIENERYEWANQKLKITPEERGRATRYSTSIDNKYCTWELVHEVSGEGIEPISIGVYMKDEKVGAKAEYKKSRQGRRCEITMQGIEGGEVSCVTTPMSSQGPNAVMKCERREGGEANRFATVPVTVNDFPFMGGDNVRACVNFVSRAVDFCKNAWVADEGSFTNYLQEECNCEHQESCRAIAKAIKRVVLTGEKTLREIAGANIYYLTKPEVGSYMMGSVLKYIPGETEMTWDWNNLAKYNELKIFHWNFGEYLKYEAEVSYEGGELGLDNHLSSEKFPWIDGNLLVKMTEVDEAKVLNCTCMGLGLWENILIEYGEGEITPLEAAFWEEKSKRGFVSLLNNPRTPEGLTNYTFILVAEGEAIYSCDVLTPTTGWAETKIECYTPQRERRIGELSLPDAPSYNDYDYTNLRKVLTEVLNVNNKRDRESITKTLREGTEGVISYMSRNYITTPWYRPAAHAAQYLSVATLHATVKAVETEEPYRIAKKFFTETYNMEPNFGEAYRDTVDYLYEMEWTSTVATIAENLLRPVLDSVAYALEGHVALEHETNENGEIIIKGRVLSYRYPLLNCETILNVKRHEWNKLTINATTINNFARISADVLLEGPSVFVEKVMLGMPETEDKDCVSIKFVPIEDKPYEIEIFFVDSQGGYYGCKGGRPNLETEVLHFHCFKVEGEEIPANPPYSSMMAYFDVKIDEVPNAGRSGVAGVLRTILDEVRFVKACYDEPETVEDILMKEYHVHDPAIRKRIARSLITMCKRWMREATEPEYEPVNRNSEGEGRWSRRNDEPEYSYSSFGRIGRNRNVNEGREGEGEGKLWTLTEGLKDMSYKLMIESAKEEVLESEEDPMEIIDMGIVYDVTSAVYGFCHPLVYYAAAVTEFSKTSGVVNASRCTTCDEEPAEARLLVKAESETFPIIDHKFITEITRTGMVNASIENNCAWGWMECEISGFVPAPLKAKFGLADSREGVTVAFAPGERAQDEPLLSLIFNANAMRRCDVTMEGFFSVSTTCHAYEGREKGAEEATCDISVMKALYEVADLTVIAATTPEIRPRRIEEVIENLCEVRTPAFKKDLAKAVSWKIEFVAEYCRREIANTVRALTEFGNITYSYIANLGLDLYNWGMDIGKMRWWSDPRSVYNPVYNAFEVVLGLCEAWTETMYIGVKVLYEAGYALNEILFDLPTIFASMSDYPVLPKYYHAIYNYINYAVKATSVPANCMCGMMTTPRGEQAITFNNHVYNFPSEIEHCPLLLAGDVTESKFTIVLEGHNLVINLPKKSLTIDRDMRLFVANEGEGKHESELPFFPKDDEKISCVRDAEAMTCKSPSVKVVVFAENNRRTGFFIEVFEPSCESTRGMLGFGANKTEVREWSMMNGTEARSFADFVNAYSIERECHVDVPESPKIEPTDKCSEIFDSEEMKAACPERRRSFFEACKTGATEPEEACRYAALHNRMCEMEGCPTKLNPECDACKGEETVNTELEKAHIVAVVALHRRTKVNKVDEILNEIREIANREHKVYEASILTFGGEGEMEEPRFHTTIDGQLEIPHTEEWRLPSSLVFNGPEPTPEELIKCVEFAYANTRRAAEGAAKIFFFIVPENMELQPLEENEKIKEMSNDFVKSFLYIPKNCQKGPKGRATIGVRPLFIEEEEICGRLPAEIAEAMTVRELGSRISCTCEVLDRYTGEVNDSCRVE